MAHRARGRGGSGSPQEVLGEAEELVISLPVRVSAPPFRQRLKIIPCCASLLLTACAFSTPDDIFVSAKIKAKEPACIKECSRTYSQCLANTSNSGNRPLETDGIRTCGGALLSCCDTCPDRSN